MILKLCPNRPNDGLMRRLSKLRASAALAATIAVSLAAAPLAGADTPAAQERTAEAPTAPALTVDTVHVTFDAKHKSAAVMVTNDGPRAVVVDVMPRVWAVGSTGGRVLAESEEVFPFPSVLNIPAGATVKLRLVHTPPKGAPDMERQFEVALEGTERADGGGWGEPVSARVDVSVAPLERHVVPTFAAPKVAHGLIDLKLENAGNVTFGARWLTFIATPVEGEPLEAFVPGWFVIPGGYRELAVALPEGMPCIKHLQVRVDTVAGTHHRLDYDIDPASCDTSPLPAPEEPSEMTRSRARLKARAAAAAAAAR